MTGGFLYVDRTEHIRDLEDFGDVLIFIRPRRFGKSLWLSTLACYYDLRRADDRDLLFGRLAIGREPTPLANSYFVLEWNLSLVDPQGSIEEIKARLWEHVNVRIRAFLEDYEPHLPGVPRQPPVNCAQIGRLLQRYNIYDRALGGWLEVMTRRPYSRRERSCGYRPAGRPAARGNDAAGCSQGEHEDEKDP